MKLQFQVLALLAVVATGQKILPKLDDTLTVVGPTDLVLAEAELVVRQVADGSNNSTLAIISTSVISSEVDTVLSTAASTSEAATTATDETSEDVSTSAEHKPRTLGPKLAPPRPLSPTIQRHWTIPHPLLPIQMTTPASMAIPLLRLMTPPPLKSRPRLLLTTLMHLLTLQPHTSTVDHH